MEVSWTTWAGIALGIGLAAATGFRVFLPLLVAGLAARFGGLANPAVATVETIGATGLSLFAIALPFVALLAIVLLLAWVVRRTGKFLFGRK